MEPFNALDPSVNDLGGHQIRGQARRDQVRRYVPGTAFALIGFKILPAAADVITVEGLPPCKRLVIVIDLIASGSINLNGLTFNKDTAANYSRQTQNNAFAAADTTAASTLRLDGGDATENRHVVIEISNLPDQEKIGIAEMVESGGAGAANAPDFVNNWIKWANTKQQITRIDVTNTASGSYAAKSSVKVFGELGI